MTAKGRLRRSFPASSIGVHLKKARTPDFQTAVAQTLALMSHQAVAGMQPQVRKADETHDEDRDTTHPGMVSDFFAGFLTANGTPLDIIAVGKNTREDVLWRDANSPWRRSAFWLLLRVSLHLCCGKLTESSQEGNKLYKQVILVFMSFIMKLSDRFHLRTEYLLIMSAKLSRRLHKLGDEIDEAALKPVQVAVENTASIMSQRWIAIQQQNGRSADLAALPALDFDRDCSMSISQLDEFIVGITNRQTVARGTDFQPASDVIDYSGGALPSGFGNRSKEEVVIQNLHGFETWVVQDLPGWLEIHKSDARACGQLANLIQQYHSIAEQYYAKNPESMSLMVLVLLELWVGCDRVAASICSLLGEYHPGVPVQHLQNLLLPFEGQMERLHCVEEYLVTRARAPRPSREIFEITDSPNCFGARYFDQSGDLQALMQTIVDRATQARNSKLEELEELKARYQTLMTQYRQAQCDRIEVIDHRTGLYEERHSGRCIRCNYKSQADRLQIEVHEWPLPEDHCRAKTVTFELRVPSWFGNWRDSTAYIIMNVLKAGYASDVRPRSRHPLSSDRQLASLYFRKLDSVQPQRIGLLSQDKPHIGTHRHGKTISTSNRKDICLRSGLNYQYHDGMIGCFVNAVQHTESMPQLCTYQLSSKALQEYIFRPANAPSGPPPNTAIAEQSKCPQQMPLSQWKALSSIPLGYHLHWWQVAMQLRMPFVDFKQTDTALVVLQCIHQAGPPCDGDKIRPGHSLAIDGRFALVILEQLNDSLLRIKQNWESSQALSIFICIARRLLSLNSDQKIRAACLRYLCDARAVAFDWVGILKTKADFAQPMDRGEFVFRSVVAALICASTFDVDRRYLATVLTPPQDASILIQCCITIRECGRAVYSSSDTQLKLLHSRHLRLLRDAFAILAENQDALHNAISQSWSGYGCSADWIVTETAPHWIVTHMSSTEENGSSAVHYDLLSGNLLVDGQPLGRLPSEYERHVSYERLFGNSTIEVMPSSAAGLRFSAKTPYFGFELQFGMAAAPSSPTDDLVVQASEGPSGNIYELLPPRLFQGQVPTSFVRDFVHWYDRTTGDVEFRPANKPWTRHSSGEWRLMKCEDSKWRLTHPMNGMFLVGAGSQTACAITTILSPLAKPLFIHLLLQPNLCSLSIEIPSLRIGFTLERGLSILRSREFPGMQVDEDQSLGTLVGFQNKLLIGSQHTDDQKVLLLEGHTLCQSRLDNLGDSSEPPDDHLEVSVERDISNKVHSFDIDKQLGGLVDNGSMQSKLVLAYLHALTSFCMPDRLTGKTGTEEALTILQSAALRSFSRLTQSNIDLLERIANELTPKRVFYPEHERVMQSVQWSSRVGFMSQHAGFYSAVISILHHEKRYDELFRQSGMLMPSIRNVDAHLLERNRIRSAAFQVSGYGAEDHTTEHDVEYNSRDRRRQSRRRADAYLFSSHISQGRATLHSGRTSSSILWNFLCRSSRVFGPRHQLDLSQIRYDATLLQDGGSFVSEAWPCLHRALVERQPVNMYSMMMWLSTLALSESVDKTVLETIALFYTTQHFAGIQPPRRKSFDVSAGYQISSQRLKQEIRLSLRSFYNCPEAKLLKRKNESRSDFGRRVKWTFEAQQDSAVHIFASALETQWPCELPHRPEIHDPIDVKSYIDVESAMRTVNLIFSTWFHNLELFRYLQRIETDTSLLAVRNIDIPTPVSPELHFVTSRPGFVGYSDLFDRPAPCLKLTVPPLPAVASVLEKEWNVSRLNSFVDEIEPDAGSSEYERKYVEGLKASVSCLLKGNSSEQYQVPSHDTLKAHWECCREQEQRLYDLLKSATTPKSSDRPPLKMVAQSNRWPRLSRKFFLQQLGRRRWRGLTAEWKACIVQHAISMTLCHRAERLLKAFQAGGPEDIINELRNEGHRKWDPMNHPERLLLEVESKIMIRDVQSDVANQMEDPQSARNTSMQLNMGEGKSSVIVPIVAAALANESRLVRVIVGKPQSRQMTQMLTSKLGSMLDRRIYHMPFSRRIKLNESAANRVRSLCRECMEGGGVLLLQPEHILSFQLMGLERCIAGDETVGRSLLQTQGFFDQSSRDIVDESDENFSVKFELIYSMGTQRHIDASPDRWLCIQEVLDLVKEIVPVVAAQLPSSVEITPCAPGAFPRIRILRPDAEKLLIEQVGRRVCEFGLAGFPISRQPRSIRDAVFTYITKWDLSASEIQLVDGSSSGTFWTESIQPKLFLLRGLLACGILAFALHQKRWRVNYGLDSTREPPTRLAVPYRAKDMPTSRSEFSHPDVVILLTALSYYYSGLPDVYLGESFSHLTQSDQKDVEYDIWIKGIPDMPEAFRQLDGINLNDRSNCTSTVFPRLRQSKTVVDYFLSYIVFPKEMKEFPEKLSASGWDIGKIKQHPTTAFSGTSDSRILLPLDVDYFDSEQQRHTNGLVLGYLLQPENSVAFIPAAAGSGVSDAKRLLSEVVNMNPPPRVILDAGAQILEMGNLEVARAWLDMHPGESARAVVFFDEDDELSVLSRAGDVESLQTSPFASQLDACLVFLDQAHTRGTDLRLPRDYRAAVTLGPNLTKDRLVQGEILLSLS